VIDHALVLVLSLKRAVPVPLFRENECVSSFHIVYWTNEINLFATIPSVSMVRENLFKAIFESELDLCSSVHMPPTRCFLHHYFCYNFFMEEPKLTLPF